VLVSLNELAPPPIGERVEIRGRIAVGDVTHLRADQIKLRGDAVLTSPRSFRADESPAEAKPYRWREFRGVVHKATKNQTGWLIEAIANGRQFKIATLRRGRAVTSYVVNAVVRFRGVTLPGDAIGESPEETVLWVDSWDRIRRLRKPPSNPFAISRTTIAAAIRMEPRDMPPGRVRLRGRVASVTNTIRLADITGEILVPPAEDTAPINRGDLVDALGFLTVRNGKPEMVIAEFRHLADATSVSPPDTDTPLDSIPWDSLSPLLRTTGAIHALWDHQSDMNFAPS